MGRRVSVTIYRLCSALSTDILPQLHVPGLVAVIGICERRDRDKMGGKKAER